MGGREALGRPAASRAANSLLTILPPAQSGRHLCARVRCLPGALHLPRRPLLFSVHHGLNRPAESAAWTRYLAEDPGE